MPDAAARPRVLPECARRARACMGCTRSASRGFGGACRAAPCTPRHGEGAALGLGAVAARRRLRAGARTARARLGKPCSAVARCAAHLRTVAIRAGAELRRLCVPHAAFGGAHYGAVRGADCRDRRALDRRYAQDVGASRHAPPAHTRRADRRRRVGRRAGARYCGGRARRRRGHRAPHARART